MLLIPALLIVFLIVYLKAKHATQRVNHVAKTNGWQLPADEGPKMRSLQEL